MTHPIKQIPIDIEYNKKILFKLLQIPSPTGYTDRVVHFVGEELKHLKIPFELTRRGAIRAHLNTSESDPGRALVTHLDTLGAMVKNLKKNGRLQIVPIGTWSSRFAEGARVTIFTDNGSRRGTILPLKASGHTFDQDIDSMPVSWDNVEVRVDEEVTNKADLVERGFRVGDTVALDPNYEQVNSFINSRYLDNKVGVSVVLTAAKAILDSGVKLPVGSHLLFTISEEVGSGASTNLHGNISEMVSIDNSTVAVGQNSIEDGVTIAMMDSSGPFDYHLTRKLVDLCEDYHLLYKRDVFKYYRCDAAAAVEAGNDLRTALICFGIDASHGYERTHIHSIEALTKLVTLYLQSPLTFTRDRQELGPLQGFSMQPK